MKPDLLRTALKKYTKCIEIKYTMVKPDTQKGCISTARIKGIAPIESSAIEIDVTNICQFIKALRNRLLQKATGTYSSWEEDDAVAYDMHPEPHAHPVTSLTARAQRSV